MRPLLLLVCAASFALAQEKPFDVETMLKLSRISEPALSPDGKLVAFTVQTVDLEKNSRPKQIYVIPLDGGVPRRAQRHQQRAPAGRDRNGYFVSTRRLGAI
jgi:dipeptidyl aminopeptidase/acylaminoacyl peptidase